MRVKLSSYFRRHWRGILNLITVVAMIALVFALRHQIIDTLRNIQRVNYWFLLLMIPLQVIDYDAFARMYRAILAQIGQPVRYKALYRIALELNFVNHAFPSGGISGFSFFSLRLRNYGVKAGTATLLQLIRFILLFLSFQVLLAVGLFALAIENKASNLLILIAAVIATLTFTATFVMAYIVGSKERIHAFFTYMTKLLNRVIHTVRPRHPETISMTRVEHFLTDMHENYMLLKGNYSALRIGFVYSLIANICEILTIYVVYLAFGHWINIGAVIIAYAIANFAGLISVLPGGIGVYEALMTAALTAGGVPAALSIPVVVMYRVLSMAIQLLPGWFLYHRAISREDNDVAEQQ